MKSCPQCGTQYDDRVDFCFKDGEVLVESVSEPEAFSVEDEFDRPLPPLAKAIEQALSADTLDAAELPEPAFLRNAADLPEPAGLDLPEPGNLDAPEPAGLAYTQEETAAQPASPANLTEAPDPATPDPMRHTLVPDDDPEPLGHVPGVPQGLPDAETRPIPLDQARPIENQAPIPEPAPTPEPQEESEPAAAMTPEPAPQHWPEEPAELPEPPPPAPEPELESDPELDAWAGGATPEPPPREDEEGRGGIPWVGVGVAAVLLLGLGFGAMKLMGSGEETSGPSDPATEEPAAVVAEADPAPTKPPAPAPTKPAQAEPVEEAPAAAEVPSDPAAEPAPGVEPSEPAAEPAPAVAEVEPEAQPAATDPAPSPAVEAPAPAAAMGTLSITSVPNGAQIYIDGELAGIAPVNMKVDHGTHKVRAASDGYKPQTVMVSVDGDKASTHLSLESEATTRKVMVYGPANATRVVVAGQTIDALPASIELPVGRHTFTVTLADGSNFQVRQQVQDSDSQNLMLLPPG